MKDIAILVGIAVGLWLVATFYPLGRHYALNIPMVLTSHAALEFAA